MSRAINLGQRRPVAGVKARLLSIFVLCCDFELISACFFHELLERLAGDQNPFPNAEKCQLFALYQGVKRSEADRQYLRTLPFGVK